MIKVKMKEMQAYIEQRIQDSNRDLHYIPGETLLEKALLTYLLGRPIVLVDDFGNERLLQMTEEEYMRSLNYFFPGKRPEDLFLGDPGGLNRTNTEDDGQRNGDFPSSAGPGL